MHLPQRKSERETDLGFTAYDLRSGKNIAPIGLLTEGSGLH